MIYRSLKKPRSEGQPAPVREAGFTSRWIGFVNTGRLQGSNLCPVEVARQAADPGKVQGQCGASDTGERFIHVVALGAIPHKTLSALIDSCLLDVEPTAQSPEWILKRDSAGFTGKFILSFETGTPE